MNRFRCLLDRTPWYELRRLQSSVSNSKIKIPARIQRNSTDILYALESTIPKDFINLSYVYHDDPYLYPVKKTDYRNRALSYEAGKKAAIWIHKEHRDLFPKHLSDPEIEAFKPPLVYTDKSQVSEEILLHAISKRTVSDALHIYKLLDSNVSNETKQILLELLCFYNHESAAQDNLLSEQWFAMPQNTHIWQYTSEINELFEFLIKQDSSIAAAAYNVMICGLTKHFRTAQAWALYQKCEEENIPLNITTYNYILWLISNIFGNKDELKIENLFNIINTINKKRIKPNVKTLNNALHVIGATNVDNKRDIAKRFLMEFKRLNIKFSLASYYYIMNIFTRNNKNGHDNFLEILHSIENENFTIEDPKDLKFFKYAMYLASSFNDRVAGDKIHKFLLAKDNYKFISSAVIENAYYSSYLILVLSTSTIEEFFKFYENLVPNVFVPSKQILIEIIEAFKYNSSPHLMKYIPRLWSDINTYGVIEPSTKFILLRLIQMDVLSPDSALRTALLDIAWDCWNIIQKEIKKERYAPIENAVTACIAIILLHGNRVKESVKVMTYTVKESNVFLPTMSEKQVNELFNNYILKECIEGAFLGTSIEVMDEEGDVRLTLESVRELITKDEPNVQITSLEEELGSGRGDNYTSMLYRVRAKGRKQIKNREWINYERAIIYKVLPRSREHREAFKSELLFRNEVAFYTHVWPALNELQTNGREVFSGVAKIYTARIDLIAMEDLRERGFKMADRRKGLQLEHLKRALKALAGFHALSLTLRETRPEEFVRLTEPTSGQGIQEVLFRTENEDWYRQYYQVAAKNAIRMVSDGLPAHMEFKRIEIMEKLRLFLDDDVFFRTMSEITAMQGPLTVFCHGDCWTNNILFKDDLALPNEEVVYLVDFQLSRVGSLALDLANLLYCCANGEIRRTHMTQLLQHYHFHLMSSLQTLNPKQPPKDPSVMWELLNEEMRRCGRFGIGLALDILPISTCESEEAPDLYEKSETSEEKQNTRAPPRGGAECARLMTDLVLELVHNHAL